MKTKKETRNVRIVVRFTEAEKAGVEKKAKAAGVPAVEYIRQSCSYGRKKKIGMETEIDVDGFAAIREAALTCKRALEEVKGTEGVEARAVLAAFNALEAAALRVVKG